MAMYEAGRVRSGPGQAGGRGSGVGGDPPGGPPVGGVGAPPRASGRVVARHLGRAHVRERGRIGVVPVQVGDE
ncbi:hypothetical protein ACWDF1_15410, partial [Streptomyces coelicoflavus]